MYSPQAAGWVSVTAAGAAFRRARDDVGEQVAHERLGAIRRAADDDRRGVAETALELAGGQQWIGGAGPHCGVAGNR